MEYDRQATSEARNPGRSVLPRAAVLAPLCVALLVLGGACGTTDAPTATTPSSLAATAPPTTRDEKVDQKIARDALIVMDDLPAGNWTETKRSLSSEAAPSTADSPLETCPEAKALATRLGLDKAPDSITAKASKFSLGDDASPSATVEETVEVRATQDDATSVANVFGVDAMVTCLKNELRQSLTSGTSKTVTIDPAKIRIERSKVGKLGDDHAVFLITVPAQSSGITVDVTFVAAFVRVGRGYVDLSYGTYAGIDVDKDVMPVLSAAVVKLHKALQS